MDKLRECPSLFGMKILQNPYLPPDTIVVSTATYEHWNKELDKSRPSPWRTGKPEKEGPYVVAMLNGPCLIAEWDGEWWTPYPAKAEEIEMWMPIPPLPKEGE